jgi:short-subunit dehydrogenase
MFDRIAGRRTLLTGASRGLGIAIAEALAAEGAELVLAARDERGLEAVARTCGDRGARARVLAVDVCRAEDRERVVREAGPVDILVNNAGVETTLALRDQTAEDVRRQIETNLLAPIELCRLVLDGMVARGRGVIVNVSSLSGKAATPFNSVYCATKHGLNGLSCSLAAELHDQGVHVGVVCPGFVSEAGMWAGLGLRAPRAMGEVSPRQVAAAVLRVIRGARQVLVTPAPMRPLLALRELLPGLEGRMLRAMGIAASLAARAEVARSRRG